MTYHCCNCGCILRGKQRRFCKDSCRKSYERKADKKDRELVSDREPQGFFERFSDALSGLNPKEKIAFAATLARLADYENTWVKRVLAQPAFYPPETLGAHTALDKTLALLSNYVSEVVTSG